MNVDRQREDEPVCLLVDKIGDVVELSTRRSSRRRTARRTGRELIIGAFKLDDRRCSRWTRGAPSLVLAGATTVRRTMTPVRWTCRPGRPGRGNCGAESGVLLDLGQQAQLLALLAWSIGAGSIGGWVDGAGRRAPGPRAAHLLAFGEWAEHTATDPRCWLDESILMRRRGLPSHRSMKGCCACTAW